MFTRNVRSVIFGAALLALAGAAVAQETTVRIAVIDLDRLVAESVAGRDLKNRLEEFQQAVLTEGTTLAEKARATQKLIADGANSLSEDRLEELKKQLEDESIAVRRFQDDKQREGQKMQNEGLQEIERKLQPVLDKVQKDGNYDLILNRAVGFVVMATDRVDITGQVIEAFDAVEATGGDTAATGEEEAAPGDD